MRGVLFNILVTVGFVTLAVSMPFFCLYFFKRGVKFGLNKETAAEEKTLPKIGKTPKDPEREKWRTISENINNYTGDRTGQKKVK